MKLYKQLLNFSSILFISMLTFWWTFQIFRKPINWKVVVVVIAIRMLTSRFMFKDHSLSWSRVTQTTFLLKTFVVFVSLLISITIFYKKIEIAFLVSEALTYLLCLTFLMFSYYYYRNSSRVHKSKSLVIYGAGKAGIKLKEEFVNTEYKLKYFLDDDRILHGRSIDGVKIISGSHLKNIVSEDRKLDLLVIAISGGYKRRIGEIYDELGPYFEEIKILPPINEVLQEKRYLNVLKEISLESLLSRPPKDLDRGSIRGFICGKKVMITGAGGSIGSEIARQCVSYEASKLILLDHSEFNLYQVAEELSCCHPELVLQSVVNDNLLEKTFQKYKPDVVIHAAAYKHVPLVEHNVAEAIVNNIVGTKNVIDLSIKYNVQKLVLISTDKAVKPTNVMGATKRVCELYAQNVDPKNTEIVAVRFGNVLGSSGSVIPKFRAQIEKGGPVTVTHPDVTRYFMLIPEACELVLQAASIGKGGEIFILDMGEPVKILDLAQKLIKLSGREDIKVEFIGLRPGEKLYEELLVDGSEAKTKYEFITVAGKTDYDIKKLIDDIHELVATDDKLGKLKKIVPEFEHFEVN